MFKDGYSSLTFVGQAAAPKKGPDMAENNLIHLPRVPAELRALGVPVSYQKAWRLVTEGELASVRDGGKVFVTREALEQRTGQAPGH